MPVVTGTRERDTWAKHGERPSLLDWEGAKADCRVYLGGSGMAVSGTALTGPSGSFSLSQVGQTVFIEDGGTGGTLPHITTVAAYVSDTQVTLAAAAPTAASNKEVCIGTDNTALLQNAIDGVEQGCLRIPQGKYLINGQIDLRHGISIVGEGIHASPWNTDQIFSELVNVAATATFRWEAASASDYLHGLNVERLNFRGNKYPGSRGIDIDIAWGPTLHMLGFVNFGEHAILISGGIDAHYSRLWCNDVWRCRDSASPPVERVGCFQFGTTDTKASDISATASIGYGSIVGSAYVDGYIAALMVTGGNSYYSDVMAHLSQIGVYVSLAGSLTTFVNCRSDLNQGEGYVIDAANCQFIGCRSHANGIDTDGTYDAFVALRGGNYFQNCQVTYNGAGATPAFRKVRHAFNTSNPVTQEMNYFGTNYIQLNSFTGERYYFDATDPSVHTRHPITYLTALDVNSRRMHVTEGDIVARDGGIADDGRIYHHFTEADTKTDEHWWAWLPNISSSFHALELRALADDGTPGSYAPFRAYRDGEEISSVEIEARDNIVFRAPIEIYNGELLRYQAASADEKLWSIRINAPGSPDQLIITAPKDDFSAEAVALRFNRAGADIESVHFPTGKLKIDRGGSAVGASDPPLELMLSASGWTKIMSLTNAGQFFYAGGSTSPEGVITAVGGSLAMDGSGKMWLKVSGTGSTGWDEVATLADLASTSLPSQSGHGSQFLQTNGSSTLWARVNLSDANQVTGSFAVGTTIARWNGGNLESLTPGSAIANSGTAVPTGGSPSADYAGGALYNVILELQTRINLLLAACRTAGIITT